MKEVLNIRAEERAWFRARGRLARVRDRVEGRVRRRVYDRVWWSVYHLVGDLVVNHVDARSFEEMNND